MIFNPREVNAQEEKFVLSWWNEYMSHEEFHTEDDCGDNKHEKDELNCGNNSNYEITLSIVINCRFNNMDYSED